jgi:hypothetical protein
MAASVAVWVAACQGNGEGQRCSTLDDSGGDSDCASPLVCRTDLVPSQYDHTTDPSIGVCCPPANGSIAPTTPVCMHTNGGPSNGVPDSGSSDSAAGTDAPSGTDSGDAAAAPDAPATDSAGADAASMDSSVSDAADGSLSDGAADAPADAPAE